MAEEAPTSQGAPTSTSDLMTSAKTVAEAAQLACSQQTDKIDKAKVSGAAEDILEAAKSYGQLDDKSGVGQYVDKAEDYLHQLHGEHGEKKVESAPVEAEKKESSGGDGGVGGLMNAAKGLTGFFNK